VCVGGVRVLEGKGVRWWGEGAGGGRVCIGGVRFGWLMSVFLSSPLGGGGWRLGHTDLTLSFCLLIAQSLQLVSPYFNL